MCPLLYLNTYNVTFADWSVTVKVAEHTGSLHTETTKTIGDWIFKDILCQWGTLCKIVTNNGPVFVKALTYLEKRYHIWHIWISGYNSQANSIVECAHFDVRQALFKACDGDRLKWHSVVTAIMWANRVTVQWHMGCSSYFTTTGTCPLLSLTITKATYLLPPPDTPLSSTDLIAWHAISLQKHQSHLTTLASDLYATWIKATNKHMLPPSSSTTSHLVTLYWSEILQLRSLNHKMRARYLGPLIVISQNKGGAYIIFKLDSSVFNHPIAASHTSPSST